MKKRLAIIFFFIGKSLFYVLPMRILFGGIRRKIKNGGLSNLFDKFGMNSDISLPTTIVGGKYIRIGDFTNIAKNGSITAWDKHEEKCYSPLIEIADNVNIGEFCHITAINKISIGNGVLTGKWVTITDNSHGKTDLEAIKIPPIKRDLYSVGTVVIEDNVWIGDKVTILPNVHIGKNAIIGANSVVTKDVPENSIVVGSPAKIIKVIN